MEAIYTTNCGMFQVIKGKSGLFYPQERIVRVAGFGRLHNEQEAQQFAASPINTVRYGAWDFFYGGFKQFSTEYHHKSFKTEKGAIAFVNRCSENLQEGL